MPMAPTARPMAAKIPANLAMSKGGGGGALPASTFVETSTTPAAAWSCTAFSRAPATFSICSPIIRAMRLYGDQNA